MVKPYIKIFENRDRLTKMLELRQNGWTYTSLALIYGVDHSSIYHQCKKFHVEKKEGPIDFSIRSLLRELEIRVPKEKTYADYLNESRRLSQMPTFRF